MNKRNLLLISVTLLVLFHVIKVCADDFAIIENFPSNGQTITRKQFCDGSIYLKFNHPIDRSTIGLIRIRDPNLEVCQLNICGCLELVDNDTRLIWHPNCFRENYQRHTNFIIELGTVKEIEGQPIYLLKDIYGHELPVTTINFGIEACDPVVDVEILGPGCRLCPDEINCFGAFSVVIGDTIVLKVTITNPECSGSKRVEGKFWVNLPDGSLSSISDPYITVELTPNQRISGELLAYTFTGGEPLGAYKIGATLLNPITGVSYSSETVTFNFKQCP